MHIDIDPAELGRNYPLALGAVADLKPALAALVRAAKKLAPAGVQRTEVLADIQRNRAAFKATCQEGASSDAWPMRPERILADVRAVLPRDAIITTDVGWNKNGLAQQMDILTPGSVFTPGDVYKRQTQERSPSATRAIAAAYRCG